jgi:hypothetical protein
MIRVYITGQAQDGEFPYRIEGQSVNNGVPMQGLKGPNPLFDACVVLSALGEPVDQLIGLLFEGSRDYRAKTAVGYGARGIIRVGLTALPPATPAAPPPPPHTPPAPLTDTGPGHATPARSGRSPRRRKRGGLGGRRGAR